MFDSAYFPYPVLREQLLAAVHQSLSGTFLVATDNNASCRFAIADGELTHCTFSRLHGEEAMIAFTQIQAGRYSFNNMLYPFRPMAVLGHERALDILDVQPASPQKPTQPKPVSGSMFTQEELEKLFGKFYFE